ncbi:helix-turn-helix domain-containing protein [Burkholderia cenocepacia]
MESQNIRILQRLQRGPLTSAEAITEFGITRLSARIYDLRADGHLINCKTVTVRNRFAQECRVARYTLVRVNPKAVIAAPDASPIKPSSKSRRAAPVQNDFFSAA